MISFVLCDDNPRHNQTLLAHLNRLLPKLPVEANVALAATSAGEVIAYAGRPHPQTIYMLDLVLEQDQSGLDLCRRLYALDPSALIIYVSAYAEYTLDCVESRAFDLVLKPYSPVRLENAVLDAVRFLCFREEAVVLQVKTGSVTRVIDQRTVRYLRSQREYVTAFLTDGQLTWRESLTRLMARLDPARFVRIHKSYVMNREYLACVNAPAREVTLADGTVLPASRRMLAALDESGRGEAGVSGKA